ncbi:MAG: hypothetical protein ISP45_05975 [Reyranella sp.]|nr:hypothetical protein [Reyranella sp.]
MMFARTDALKPLHRPQLVLLSAGEGLDASGEKACRDADADGFDVLVVPWRALVWQFDGAAAIAGLAFFGGGVQPITRSTRLKPELIAAIDWLEPLALSAAVRLGLLNPDAVLGCHMHRSAVDDKGSPVAGVIALAPLVIHALHAEKDGTAHLRKIAAGLSRVLPRADRSTLADPSRVVLSVDGKVFGFRQHAGAPVNHELFAAWRSLARRRAVPPAPILLPMAKPPGPALLRGGLKRLTGGASLPPHPLAALLPSPAEGHVRVVTKANPDAKFVHLAPGLKGPDITGYPTGEAGLLQWLGRTIDTGGDPATADSLDIRFVEPGVGRSILIDRLHLPDKPHLVDFTALGAGVTPYASGGYANVGRLIDGMAGRDRGQHRRRCAELLEAEGCRAGQVVAVIEMPGSIIRVPHAPEIQAAVMVRGFRCLFRVKQLDPVGHFLHSEEYRAAAHELMMHPFWSPATERRTADPLVAWQQQHTLAGLDAYAQAGSLAALVGHALMPPADPGLGEARARRLAMVRLYAPLLLRLARARLAIELGRDPDKERPDNATYVGWFARSLGRQLATFYRLKFLHDYHHPGVARTSEASLHSLSENNVSLLAEFPDLETGMFVDRPAEEQLDTLFLTSADHDVLKENYGAFHAMERSYARSIVRTLAFVALDGDPAGITVALHDFDRSYAGKLESKP